MQLSEKDRQLTIARTTASKLISTAHQLPLDLSLNFTADNVTRLCEQIITLARQVERAVADIPQEFEE